MLLASIEPLMHDGRQLTSTMIQEPMIVFVLVLLVFHIQHVTIVTLQQLLFGLEAVERLCAVEQELGEIIQLSRLNAMPLVERRPETNQLQKQIGMRVETDSFVGQLL